MPNNDSNGNKARGQQSRQRMNFLCYGFDRTPILKNTGDRIPTKTSTIRTDRSDKLLRPWLLLPAQAHVG